MLGELFQKVLDMSLIGCYSILIVMAVRLLLSRFERKFTYYLWFVVFLNLCIPISFQGFFSLIPGFVAEFSVSDAVEDVLGSRVQGESDAVIIPTVPGGVQGTGGNYNFALGNPGGADYLPQALAEDTTPQTINIASGVWLAGIAVLLVWSLAGMLRLRKQISRDNWIRFSSKQGIAEVADLDTPFLWGIFNPMIYLPADLEPEEMRYIVAHEQYHKKRKDYLIKIAVFLVAAIHWFNPLVWAAYTLFCRDMEISCDEAVLLEFKENIRKQYAGSLLKYAARQSGFVLSPITFGEPAVKTRIKNVLRFRKRGIVISVLTVICVAGVAAGLVLRPFAEEKMPEETSGQNTAEGELLNLSAGVDEILSLSAGKVDDISEEDAAGEITREPTTILTLIKEGIEEAEPATLYVGNGYSFYLIDDQWVMTEPGSWYAKVNENVRFWIDKYEGLTLNQVEEMLIEQGYSVGDEESLERLYKYEQDTDAMNRVLCYETESGVWTMNSVHSLEGGEGWRVNIMAMFDTFIVTEGYGKNPHGIVLTDEQKTLLQTMCNYLPDFSEATLMEDERFWSNFIYSSFTSVPMEYGKYKPIYGEGEEVMVYREDWGYEEPAFKISERYVREYVRLILGVEMPEFKPAFEDIKENQSVYYYQDGYYYIGGSDFGEAEYRFRDLEVSRERLDTSALVSYDILLHNVDTGEQEVEGTVQFYLNYADNSNGFVIVGKEVEWD